MRCQAEFECSAAMMFPSLELGPSRGWLGVPGGQPRQPWLAGRTTGTRVLLPWLQPPAEDEADAEARDGNNLRSLAGVFAEISQKVIDGPQLIVAVDGFVGRIGYVVAIVHDV